VEKGNNGSKRQKMQDAQQKDNEPPIFPFTYGNSSLVSIICKLEQFLTHVLEMFPF
jgi:hypothetical protein